MDFDHDPFEYDGESIDEGVNLLDTTAAHVKNCKKSAHAEDDDDDEYEPVHPDELFETGFCFLCKYGVLDQDSGPVRDKLQWMVTRMHAAVHAGVDSVSEDVHAYYEEHVRPLLDEGDDGPEWTLGSIKNHLTGAHGTAQVAIMKRMNLQFMPKAMAVLQRNLVMRHRKHAHREKLNIPAWKVFVQLSKHIAQDYADTEK